MHSFFRFRFTSHLYICLLVFFLPSWEWYTYCISLQSFRFNKCICFSLLLYALYLKDFAFFLFWRMLKMISFAPIRCIFISWKLLSFFNSEITFWLFILMVLLAFVSFLSPSHCWPVALVIAKFNVFFCIQKIWIQSAFISVLIT